MVYFSAFSAKILNKVIEVQNLEQIKMTKK